MTSPDSELKKISTELKHLSLKRQQLLERKKIQCIFQELRNRAEFETTGDTCKRFPANNNICRYYLKSTSKSLLSHMYGYIVFLFYQRRDPQIRMRSTALMTNWDNWQKRRLNSRKARINSSMSKTRKTPRKVSPNLLQQIITPSHFAFVTTFFLLC